MTGCAVVVGGSVGGGTVVVNLSSKWLNSCSKSLADGRLRWCSSWNQKSKISKLQQTYRLNAITLIATIGTVLDPVALQNCRNALAAPAHELAFSTRMKVAATSLVQAIGAILDIVAEPWHRDELTVATSEFAGRRCTHKVSNGDQNTELLEHLDFNKQAKKAREREKWLKVGEKITVIAWREFSNVKKRCGYICFWLLVRKWGFLTIKFDIGCLSNNRRLSATKKINYWLTILLKTLTIYYITCTISKICSKKHS